MSTVDKALGIILILSVLLVAVAYFTGLSQDATSVSNALQKLIYAITGRNGNGQFAAYPTGG